MAIADNSRPDSNLPRFLLLATICLAVGVLYFAREVLIPIALAILLSFLLAPLVRILERWRLPRTLAVIVTVLLTFGVLSGLGYTVYSQGKDLQANMGTYANHIRDRVHSMRENNRLFKFWSKAGEEVKQALAEPATRPKATDGQEPIPVYTVNAPERTGNSGTSPLDLLGSIGSMLLGPMGTAFIVVVFTIFMLLQREDLRDRMIRLMGRDQLTTTTQALDDAAARVSRYLLMQSIVNGGVGCCVGLGLWLTGKIAGVPFPSPALWGLLAALLRFIPYVGIWISALLPLALSLAVFQSLKPMIAVIGLYGTIEVIAGNAIEPLLYGGSTGIATLAVLVAAAFWTWLWGPVGLLLSTPLTVCLVVMGKYVPQLEFLTILLAEEPALSPSDRVYQRLLALDQEEASELVLEYAAKMPLEDLYQDVLVPALAAAEQDQHRGVLDDERHTFIRDGIRDIVEELGDQHKAAKIKADAASSVEAAKGEQIPGETTPASRSALATPPPGMRVMLPKDCTISIVILPAADTADEIAAIMFGQLLQLRGFCVAVSSSTQLASEMVEAVQTAHADLVCVSALPPAAVTHARYLCKRLQGKLPDIEMLVGLWNAQSDLARAKERIAGVRPVQTAARFMQAIELIQQMVQPRMIQTAIDESGKADSNRS